MPKSILIPLPSYGFDPTESAVVEEAQRGRCGRDFRDARGQAGRADIRMVTGQTRPRLCAKV